MSGPVGGMGGGMGGAGQAPEGALSDAEVARLEEALEGAALLGAELEPTYRVLALTLETQPGRTPWERAEDRRIQLLASPVSTMLVALTREDEAGARELLTFEQEQLVDIVAALDAPALTGQLFGRGEPRPGEWAPRFSLQGRSSAPNGTLRTIRIEAGSGDLRFGLFARFDDVEVRDPEGSNLRLPS